MAIAKLDHFTVLTDNTDATVEFYSAILGFHSGPRPGFPFPGAWLYNGAEPVLHVITKDNIPVGGGVLDHMAFRGSDLAGFIGRLQDRGLAYDLRRLPAGGPAEGTWQLFFNDPNGARVEIDFAADERAPESAGAW